MAAENGKLTAPAEPWESEGMFSSWEPAFIEIPFEPRSGRTTAALSIIKKANKAGKTAMLATTHDQGRWLERVMCFPRVWIAHIGDLDTLSRAGVLVVDDAELMEVVFSKIYPRSGSLRAHLAKLANARIYWLTRSV